MNADAVSVALNLLAFIGAGAYTLGLLSARERTPVDIRLAALLGLLMLLVGVRALRWELNAPGLRNLEDAVAALLPLCALTLAEGLLRRHAPGILKLSITALTLVFFVGALLRPDMSTAALTIALGLYMALSLGAIALLLGLRDHDTLAPGENAAISALSAGLIVALPLVATDFLTAAGFAPIRAGGLGVLVFVFAVARVTALGGNGFHVLREMLWSMAGALLAFGVLVYVFGLPDQIGQMRILALVMALVLVLRIVQFGREQRQARQRASLWQAFAEAPADNLDAFLSRMLAAPELERARLLDGDLLKDYDHDALRRAFAAAPVISNADARLIGGGAAEQLGVLFEAHEATHAALISDAPLRLLVVNLPRVGAGPDAVLQLSVFSKLAAQAGGRHA